MVADGLPILPIALNMFLLFVAIMIDKFISIAGPIVLPEECRYQSIVVYNLHLFLFLFDVVVFEDTVHALGVELEVAGDSTHPGLVHPVEAVLDDVSNFEVDEGVVLVEVDLDDVGDEEEGELHFPGLSILGEVRGDVFGFADIVIETTVGDLPLHFLQSGPQKKGFQLVHHHYFDHLQHDLVERDAIHVRLFLPILTNLLEQDVRVIGKLILHESVIVQLVSLSVRRLRCPLWFHYLHGVHHTFISNSAHQSPKKVLILPPFSLAVVIGLTIDL